MRVSLAGANRDPEVFPGPDGFDHVYAMLSANADPVLDFLLER